MICVTYFNDGVKMTEKATDVYAEKRKKALEYLGTNWVLHPKYVSNPKHSLTGIKTGKYQAIHMKECGQ